MKTGVGILLIREVNGEEQILLGKRLAPEGYGMWAMPGGTVESSEYPNEAAARELCEETGIYIHPDTFQAWTFRNGLNSRGERYVTYFMYADWNGQTVKNMEPEKCVEWKWFSFKEARKLDTWDGCKEVINNY